MAPASNDSSHQPVAVIGGTGALGLGLALRFAQAEVPLLIGSRSLEKAEAIVTDLRSSLEQSGASEPKLDGVENIDAARSANTVFLTVPFVAQRTTLKGLAGSFMDEAVLVDTTAPLEAAVGGPPTRPLNVWAGSAAQQAQSLVGNEVQVVSCLHTVAAKGLSDLDHNLDEDTFLCGDDGDAKARVASLLTLIPGLRPIDCGGLEMARVLEQLTPLLIGVNKRYKSKHSGLRITGLEIP